MRSRRIGENARFRPASDQAGKRPAHRAQQYQKGNTFSFSNNQKLRPMQRASPDAISAAPDAAGVLTIHHRPFLFGLGRSF
jgi:hypothetical protein